MNSISIFDHIFELGIDWKTIWNAPSPLENQLEVSVDRSINLNICFFLNSSVILGNDSYNNFKFVDIADNLLIFPAVDED